MQPEINCLFEDPYLADADNDFNKHEDKPSKLSPPKKRQQPENFGEVGDYNIVRTQGGYTPNKKMRKRTFHLVHKKTGETHMKVSGLEHVGKGNDHKFQVELLSGHKDSTIKAHEFYHHLITNHGIELHSDNIQTPGGKKVWQKLSKYKDIHIDHVASDGKKLKLHKRNWDANYGDEVFGSGKSSSRFVARKK